ncbi:ATPase domain-containing protein [Coleofasciculus sp. FACHB-1120]|uniref:ATPase domain-containing protein n=1 Tax=Coleofasciculus sp. FACHB-1120 TaxID=2692783 RepID=UPI001686110F|nr:ATPase domain-containing protein [Coleofasciculus sp. FACHB-1120]MBD2742255.1 AAA family ATPase [Coleofasciculus sp. FACHB-1120]
MSNIKLIPTGVPNLDAVMGGGIPVYSLNIVAGQPGTGKTILVQQMLFNHIRNHSTAKVLYLTTLSEPTLKVVRYMQCFSFFDAEVFGEQVLYQDIGPFIREHSLPELADYILTSVEKHQPEILAIDSFKAIRDLSNEVSDFRRFCYDLSVRLASARCTAFLLGEYDRSDIGEGAEFAVADGIIYLNIALQEGEQQRFLQVYKMRGRATEMVPYPFALTDGGVQVLGSMLTLKRRETSLERESESVSTGIKGLDDILRGGIPRGRSILLSGVSGTGKTTLAMQFLVNGAHQGEKGLLFSFEETRDRLFRMAEGFGWNPQDLEAKGLLRIIFIPQTEIRVEEHLERMAQEIASFQPSRFVIDSFSVFLHKVKDLAVQREKTFQLSTLVQRVGAVGFFISNIPAGEVNRLSRFGVEETVVDGTIVLSTDVNGLQRRRYIEVYKMRTADHVPGRHRMEIGHQGIEVLYLAPTEQKTSRMKTPPLLAFSPLNAIAREGVFYGSAWLVRGEQGVGKTTLAQQFAIEGLQRGESALFIATEAPSYLLRQQMEVFGVEIESYLRSQHLRILDTHPFSREEYIDLTDMERFLYDIERHLRAMPKPCRLITDSLTPLAVQYAPDEFITFIERKNRLLRQLDVALFDTILPKTLNESILYSLLNSYDVVLDVYVPNWGEMGQSGQGFRVLQARKSRGTHADTRPYPYTIRQGKGVSVQEGFYGEI